jgi:sporulation protein YlmC with PRC-barrel domain
VRRIFIMNKSAFLMTVLAALTCAATSAQAQSAPTPTPAINFVQTSKIVGMKVKDSNGEMIGTIKDVVLDRETGCMAYTVISTGDSGTRLTGTTKTVPVPWSVYGLSSDPTMLTLTVDRERVYGAPAFEYSRINDYSNSTYISNVYAYFGVQPIVAARAGSKGESNPETQVSATPQPSPSSTPLPSATAIPSVTPSPPPTATPEPSASATVSPSATPKPRPSWASAATHGSAAPSATARARKTPAESSDEEEESPKGRHHREGARATPTPTPTPKKTTW